MNCSNLCSFENRVALVTGAVAIKQEMRGVARLLVCVAMVGLSCANPPECRGQGVPAPTMDWNVAEDPAVSAVNRESARADLLPPQEACLSLDGAWRFSWCGEPGQRPADFWRTDYDDADWQTIDVPSCVELRGYGVPHYTNVLYPHRKAPPKILDAQSGKADYNPVSCYRRR